MIVIYDKETVTGMHMHPNAESMFVLLDGAIQFTVNGELKVVKPGQAAILPWSLSTQTTWCPKSAKQAPETRPT
jgi:mannose-6-phosphate isomerase-like protein (cupin superfamily)